MENASLVIALETLGEKIQALTDSNKYKDFVIKELEQKLIEAEKKIQEFEKF